MLHRAALLPLATALLACTPKAPPGSGSGGPGEVRIPPGCEVSLAGEWLHASAPSWRYMGEDDGGTLVLTVSRIRSDGGTGEPGAQGPRIELRRTSEGFQGRVEDSVFATGDTRCSVSFPTEVVSCADGGLTLSTAARAFVDQQCNPAPQAGPPRRDLHQLVRPTALPEPAVPGATDGGLL